MVPSPEGPPGLWAARPYAIDAPFADALSRVTATGIASLHALPLSGGHSLVGSALRPRYDALFGERYLATDVAFSAPVLDSFFRPRACLARAQGLAAQAFGADSTLFVTSGSTLANQVGLDALLEAASGDRGGRPRVLVDRTNHQSIHFASARSAADVQYASHHYCCQRCDRSWSDVDDLLARFQDAAKANRPFDVVTLSGSSYDGAMLDIYHVLCELMRYTDTLHVLVDEAWTAINAFHPDLRRLTALDSATRIRAEQPDKRLQLIVTHSAHKSMSALRQGSYLHVSGDAELSFAAENALYRHHTTSPSLPILASLDLARAQAELEGAALMEQALQSAVELGRLLASDRRLERYSAAPPAGTGTSWILPDPTKILLELDGSSLSPEELRVRLARDYGLYVARTAGVGLLLNFHIGVTAEVFGRLLQALREIAESQRAGVAPAGVGETGFLIAYPPGVPLRVPGESVDESANERAAYLQRAGAALFAV